MTATQVGQRQRQIRDAYAHFREVDPVLSALIDRRPDYDPDAWLQELPDFDLFGCLVFQVIGQQLSVTATRIILRRVTDRFGGRLPSPAQLLKLSQPELREMGISWRKAGTMLALAARFADGRLSERRLGRASDEAVLAELTQVSGIGPWTVHGALLIALKRRDVVPGGDLMLRHSVKTQYGLDHLPSEDEVMQIAEPWHPHGSLAVNLLFAAAEAKAD